MALKTVSKKSTFFSVSKTKMHGEIFASALFITVVQLLFVAPHCSVAGTSISGTMDGISFSSLSNPYYVEKDLVVPKGKTVTIPQGCVFLFSPFAGIKVEGTLIVLGIPDSPVVFTSVNDSIYNKNSMRAAEPFDWNGISLNGESHGSQLRNVIVQYSVYGVKAQDIDFNITNGVFRSNGQFHVTTGDSIHDVIDNIPYTFGMENRALIESIKPVIMTPDTSPKTPADRSPEKPVLHFIKSKPYRYSSLGVGVLCTGIGVAYGIFSYRHQSTLKQMSSGEILRDKSDWNAHQKAKWKSIGRCVGSSVVGGIGLGGFAISLCINL